MYTRPFGLDDASALLLPAMSAFTDSGSEAEGRFSETDSVTRCGIVAIAGRPNVGKSTLLNRILGQELAITSDKAQTTRHALLGVKTCRGAQAIYVDTPGINQRGGSVLSRYLNRTARTAVADVDLILFVVEAMRFTAEDDKALRAVAEASAPALAVINKIDRVQDKRGLLPFLHGLSERHDFEHLVPVSAATGDQFHKLEELVLARLPSRAPLFPADQLTDRPERFFAAELLREQLMRRYGDELPYSTSVQIERFEDEGSRYRIRALILVERPRQKGIIIGHRGQALKAAATQARLKMQELFDCPVHLDVWVKVEKGWAGNEAALARLGY